MAESWYLKIDGIEGDSTAIKHEKEIEVLGWSWGVTQSTTATGHGGGMGAGKATFGDLHVVTRIGRASPAVMLACASGSHIKSAVLTGARTAGQGQSHDFLKYTLSDVLVTSVHHADDEGDAPREQIALSYRKIEIAHTAQGPSGKPGPTVTAGWDVSKNRKV